MPRILDESVKSLQRKGMKKALAYAIAVSNLQKSGYLQQGSTRLTEEGKKYSRKYYGKKK